MPTDKHYYLMPTTATATHISPTDQKRAAIRRMTAKVNDACDHADDLIAMFDLKQQD